MKCSRCNGEGSVPYHIADDLFDETNCPLCGGSGEVITEQEYIQTCNTEQLAEWIAHQSIIVLLENQNNHSLRMTYPAYWVEWLKQPHTD